MDEPENWSKGARADQGAVGVEDVGADDDSGTLDVFQMYQREIQRIPRLTADQERELGARALAGDPDARRRLVEANLRFVVWLARRYWRQGGGLALLDLTLLDLTQEGRRFACGHRPALGLSRESR